MMKAAAALDTGLASPAAKRARIWTGCAVLALVTAAVYWPATHYGFVTYDDPYHVVYNRFVSAGLSREGVSWAMRTCYAGNWQPLTWISHMLDCTLFGLRAGGHHLTNLLLHAANSVLVFLVLLRATAAGGRYSLFNPRRPSVPVGRCFLVAALFAWHPLHVESVAWITERKDVLSAFFFLAALWAYVGYAQGTKEKSKNNEQEERHGLGTTTSERDGSGSSARTASAWRYYALALFLFALGLMSKPMLVTTPFVLLLLDYWPLGRFEARVCSASEPSSPRPSGSESAIPEAGHWRDNKIWRPLLVEKIPFFLLSAISCGITFFAQKQGGAVASLDSLPFSLRWQNAAVSYLRYLEKTLWPAPLTICYPHPGHWPLGIVAAAVIIVGGGCAYAITQARRQPYWFTGWFCFVGMLVPVVGLVQVGAQSMADRYMYLPSIGLFIALVWTCSEWVAHAEQKTRAFLGSSPADLNTVTCKILMGAGALVLLAACTLSTSRQLTFWRNGETLFRHALAVSADNGPACDGLGVALSDSGQLEEALVWFRKSVHLQPESADAQFNLGNTLLEAGRPEESLQPFETSLRIWPENPRAQLSYGCALFRLGRLEDASAHFAQAARLDSESPQAHYDLGMALLAQSKVDQALAELGTAVHLDPSYAAQAVKLAPNDPLLRFNLGTVLLLQSRVTEAVEQLAEAVRLAPQFHEAHRNLAVALLRQGKAEAGLDHFAEAVRLDPENASLLFDYGQALLAQNRPQEAAAEFARCVRLKPDDAPAQYQLALAYAAQHHFPDAAAAAQKAHDLAVARGLPELAAQAGAALKEYQHEQ